MGSKRRLSHLCNSRTDGRLRDAQAHARCRDARTSDQATAPDARRASELHPLAALPLIERHRLDALAERQILAQPNDAERDLAGELEREARREHAVVRRPVGDATAIQHIAGHEPPVAAIAARVAGGHSSASRKIGRECGVDDAAEFTQCVDIVVVNPPAAIGWEVEQERRAAAHRRIVEIDQLPGCLDLLILVFVIKPARPNRDVALGGHPMGARTVTAVQPRHVGPARHEVLAI